MDDEIDEIDRSYCSSCGAEIDPDEPHFCEEMAEEDRRAAKWSRKVMEREERRRYPTRHIALFAVSSQPTGLPRGAVVYEAVDRINGRRARVVARDRDHARRIFQIPNLALFRSED